MTLKEKTYEALKFIVKLIPLIVTFIGATFTVIGVSEGTTTIILTVLGALGALTEGIVEICKANWYKNLDAEYEFEIYDSGEESEEPEINE